MPRTTFVVTQRPGALLETFPSFIETMTRVMYSTEGGQRAEQGHHGVHAVVIHRAEKQ